MGGHQSSQTIDVTTNVLARVVQNTAQNCINVAYGENIININGDFNIVQGVDQSVSISIDSSCSTFAQQNSTFSSDLSDSISQVLKDQEVAMTQWMDNSKDDQTTNLNQSVTATFTQDTVQNCVNNLKGQNILVIAGNANVVKGIVQDTTLSLISRCILQNDQTSSVVSDITNSANQQGSYVAENPLAFLTDALKAIARDAMVVAAVIFIVILCFIFLLLMLRRKKTPAAAAAAPVYVQAASSQASAPGFGAPAGYAY